MFTCDDIIEYSAVAIALSLDGNHIADNFEHSLFSIRYVTEAIVCPANNIQNMVESNNMQILQQLVDVY